MQDISINQCRTNIGIDLAGLIFTEYEFAVNNYSTFTDFQKSEISRIFNISFSNAKNLFYEDRNTEYPFSFGNYLQTLFTTYVDPREPSDFQNILLSDVNDFFLQNMNTILKSQSNLENYRDVLKNIFRNFPYYASTTKKLRDQIQSEFISSIDITSNNVVLLMSLMMSIISVIKLFEYFIFSIYYIRITKLVNIFLRISAKEAINEYILTKEVLSILENPSVSYMHVYFPEKCLNKKETQFEDAELQNLSVKKKKAALEKHSKKRKNISLFNLRNLSKTRVYFFIVFTFVIGIGYFFGNYYFWTLSANNVSNLLKINTMFNNLYIFSTTALNYQRFLVREKFIEDSEYSNNSEYYQNHDNRLDYFSTSFIDRINQLNTFTSELPLYALPAQAIISDPLFDDLVSGDSCMTLLGFKIISDDSQLALCQRVFNGAFQNGILTLLNEFTNNLTMNEFSIVIDKNDAVALSKEKNRIIEFLKGESHVNVVIGDYYLGEVLYIFYNFLKNYYSDILKTQILNLQTFVWITCIVFSFLIAMIALLTWRYLTRVYTHLSWCMGLIPYEKLSNDEQTTFLIKQYWKEHN